MNDVVKSIVRTITPFIWGALGAIGIEATTEAADGLGQFLTVVVGGVVYAAIRYGEQRWPWLGRALGVQATPTYSNA